MSKEGENNLSDDKKSDLPDFIGPIPQRQSARDRDRGKTDEELDGKKVEWTPEIKSPEDWEEWAEIYKHERKTTKTVKERGTGKLIDKQLNVREQYREDHRVIRLMYLQNSKFNITVEKVAQQLGIHPRTVYRHRKELVKERIWYANNLAKGGYVDEVMQKIDELEEDYYMWKQDLTNADKKEISVKNKLAIQKMVTELALKIIHLKKDPALASMRLHMNEMKEEKEIATT